MKTEHPILRRKEKLDQFTLDIEFLLISVVQGVALATLGTTAANLLGDLNFSYWLYVISGFIFILIFWSGAIIHALSFIDWPLNLPHNFLYFLASLIEVMAFSHMADPLRWFGFIFFFFLVAEILYVVDLFLIKSRKKRFIQTGDEKLYNHIYKEQVFEMKILVPLGMIFNIVAFCCIYTYPDFFITNHYHIGLIALQILFAVLFLNNSMSAYKKRATLITESFDE